MCESIYRLRWHRLDLSESILVSYARTHVQGYGFEGFANQRVYDSRNGLYTYNYYGQLFPYTGIFYQTVTKIPAATVFLSQRNSTLVKITSGGPATRVDSILILTP